MSLLGYLAIGIAAAFTLLGSVGLTFRLTSAAVIAVAFYVVLGVASSIAGFTWNGLIDSLEVQLEDRLFLLFGFLGGK